MTLTLRKTVRLPRSEYIGKRIYFLTICVEERRPIFLDSGRALVAIEELKKVADRMNMLVHAYCIMPDHVHLLAEGITAQADVVKFVAQWKQGTGFALRHELPPRFWQKGFYDHVLGRAQDSDAVAWYIWMNPVRRGIASSHGEYPFAGSFTVSWPIGVVPQRAWTPPWKIKA
jgi:REP-associated tyrosine transposase